MRFSSLVLVSICLFSVGARAGYEQWGLKNQGHSISVFAGDVKTEVLRGERGEDIDLEELDSFVFKKRLRPVRVAVLDSGVDATHAGLKNRIISDPQLGDFSDQVGHGTHVAGIIAGQDEGHGVVGVAPNALIIPIRVIDKAPQAPVRPQALGSGGFLGFFGGAVKRNRVGSKIQGRGIKPSMVLPGRPDSADFTDFEKAVAEARAQGVIIIAAAGNDATSARVSPCQTTGVICVAAHGPDGRLAHFSNYGSFVELAAPGISILSTWPLAVARKKRTVFGDFFGYELKDGTSMAAPFVAGAAALLLGAGYSSDEVVARLLLGARANGYEGARGGQSRAAKSVQFGKLDVRGALSVYPKPLILPLEKRPLRLAWDQVSSSLSFEVGLKNNWVSGKKFSVRASLSQRPSLAGVSLVDPVYAQWKTGEQKTFRGAVQILDLDRFEGRFDLVLEFVSEDDEGKLQDQSLRVPVDVVVPVGLNSMAGFREVLIASSFETPAVKAGAEFRSVVGDPLSLMAFELGPNGLGIKWLEQTTDIDRKFVVRAQGVTTVPRRGDLLAIHRLFSSGAKGSAEFVLVYQISNGSGGVQGFHFEVLDSELQGASANSKLLPDYAPRVVAFPENFQWVSLRIGALAVKSPVWIGFGPSADSIGRVPVSDAWEKMEDPAQAAPSAEKDAPDLRLFTIGSGGIRELALPKDMGVVALFPQTQEFRGRGEVIALLRKGEGAFISYFYGRLGEGGWGELVSIKMDKTRTLFGLQNVLEVTRLESGLSAGASSLRDLVFFGPSNEGVIRATLLPGAAVVAPFGDQKLRAGSSSDVALSGLGAFLKDGAPSYFIQTLYDLQFHDFATGEVASTTLGRFSFLPGLVSKTRYFPVVVGESGAGSGGAGGEKPAMLLPAGFGPFPGLEVIVPEYSGGHLTGLTRPARFRFEDGEGCSGLPTPRRFDGAASSLFYFCGDRFVEVKLGN
ncbi:S8 family serine peptidase [Bdellovibrionota bacterium FG-2]